MHPDEKAIRAVVETWIAATKAGDLKTVLGLMTDDVLFLTPGREPFGKEAFAAQSASMKGMAFNGTSDIAEIEVLGDVAWIRNKLRITMTPPGGMQMSLSGWVLTILKKNSAGQWQVARDANMVMPEKSQ